MAKSKHAPALFELITKPPRPEGLLARAPEPKSPGAAGERPMIPTPQPTPQPVSKPVGTQPAGREIVPELAEPPRPVVVNPPIAAPPVNALRPLPAEAHAGYGGDDPVDDDGGTGHMPERWWSISGGRIRFSFNQREATIAVACIGLALLLVNLAGYAMGQRSGRAAVAAAAVPESGPASIETLRDGPVTRRLFEGVGADPTEVVPAVPADTRSAPEANVPSAAAYESASPGWTSGHTYIVIQDFRKDARQDAETAQAYMEQNGIPTVVLERSGNYPYRLITVQGFDRDNQVQRKLADDYQERIRRLGQAYLRAGGRYEFKDAYFIKLTGDTW